MAEHKKLKGKAADVWTAVTIRPSVFWLVDYTEVIYARWIAKDVETTSDAYTACGLEFDLAPGVRSDVLLKAADGRETLTFTTAERLRARDDYQGDWWRPGLSASCQTPIASTQPRRSRQRRMLSLDTIRWCGWGSVFDAPPRVQAARGDELR